MLFDVFPLLLASISAHADQLSQQLTAVVLNIPVWEQYRSFLEWSLNGLANIFNSAGLAIVAFTIIIKTILLPLTVKSIRSSRNMQELAPKIKEIQKKYGKDRQRASQETMALYQQHGVNPMAGCLPMLIQIPIFFGLYRAIYNLTDANVGAWANGFAWIPDLGSADPWMILPVLAGLFQFLQIRMMRPAGQKVTDPQQRIMNTMMNFMPIMIVVIGFTFPAGPVLYWVSQSLYSVVQQWLITGWGDVGNWFPWLPELPDHRRLGYKPPRDPNDVVVVSGTAGAVEQKGFQGWMARKMQEAQEQQQARQEERNAAQKANRKGGNGSSRKSEEDEAEADDTVQKVRENRRSSSYQDRVGAASKFKTKNGESNGFGLFNDDSSAEEFADGDEADEELVEVGASRGSSDGAGGGFDGRTRNAYRNPRATASRAKAKSRKKR